MVAEANPLAESTRTRRTRIRDVARSCCADRIPLRAITADGVRATARGYAPVCGTLPASRRLRPWLLPVLRPTEQRCAKRATREPVAADVEIPGRHAWSRSHRAAFEEAMPEQLSRDVSSVFASFACASIRALARRPCGHRRGHRRAPHRTERSSAALLLERAAELASAFLSRRARAPRRPAGTNLGDLAVRDPAAMTREESRGSACALAPC